MRLLDGNQHDQRERNLWHQKRTRSQLACAVRRCTDAGGRRRQAARDGVSQQRRKNVGEMAGEARFSREMAAARGLIGDPAQARRDSPDPGRRHDGRGHPAAIFGRRAGRAAA